MATMRLSRPEDIARQRELWKLSFGDDWEYIDTYYDHTHDPGWAVVLEDDDGVVQTMLIGFPVDLTLPEGGKLPAIYYYALGTDPVVRKRGYGRQLFRFAEQTYLAQGRTVMTLLPGEPSLYNFFLTIDYDDRCFTIRQYETQTASLPETQWTAHPADPADYNVLREQYLAGSFHLSFSDVYVQHQKNVANLYNGELLTVACGDVRGCASVEYAEDGTLLVKELLVPEGQTLAALSALVKAYPAETVRVNLPNLDGFDPLGEVMPYGTTHWMVDEEKQKLAGRTDGYLGLALD